MCQYRNTVLERKAPASERNVGGGSMSQTPPNHMQVDYQGAMDMEK